MPRRTDSNQSDIIRMLREFGASVQDLSQVGHGCPDLMVGYRGRTFPMEVKSADGKLTPDEVKWRDNWKGNYYVIRDIETAMQILCDAED